MGVHAFEPSLFGPGRGRGRVSTERRVDETARFLGVEPVAEGPHDVMLSANEADAAPRRGGGG